MNAGDLELVLPLAVVFAAGFLAPLVILLVLSLRGGAETWTLANYVKFFGDAFNLSILAGTLRLGLKATLLCLVFGYPTAWLISRAGARWRSVLTFVVILPLLTSVVVRTFAWIVILGRQGVLNQMLLGLGVIGEPLRLLYTETGVAIVLAQVQLPLMVLPILTVLSRIDPGLGDASRALGAGEWRTLWRITLPLSLPGVVAGCILTFAASTTAFVTQTLIGGARLIYMPLDIYQQAVGANDWPFAAALAIVFMVTVVAVVTAAAAVGRTGLGHGGI